MAIGVEAVPNRDSRVRLTNDRDALGMRRTSLDWRITESDVLAMRTWLRIASEALQASGLGEVDLARAPSLDAADLRSGVLVDAGHHMGTTRMSASSRTGVVDPMCRVHGVTNLYVCSSSVFPSGGISNPTLTIVALAIRLAQHLGADAA
jgi:choline dehydrogenase-like flavoprotein